MKKTYTTSSLCLIVGIVLCLPQQSSAQDSNRGHRFWLTPGLWVGSESPFAYGALSANVSVQYGVHLVSVRGNMLAENNGTENDDLFSDVSILYGRATVSKTYHASIAAGIGWFDGQRDWSYNEDSGEDIPNTVGLSLETQLFWRPLSFAGIGMYGFANINKEESFYGATLSLQLGKLR